jgi:3-hydroxyisobutyrate dehydrogenase
MAKIGFLGAGVMGGAMIRNLLGGGHEVCVYNRTLEKARPLEADGATLAATPKEAAAGADAIYSMVTNDNASRACWTGADGALEAEFKSGALAIEGSSVSRDWVLELAGLAAAKGLRFLDCPVAGRPDVAEAGTLWVYAGGAAEDVEAARPILEPLSRSITHFGPTGSGIAFKLIYNVMGTVQVAALGEALYACEAAGIDLATAAETFSTANTASPHVVRHSRYMAHDEHEDPVQFSAFGRIKDLSYGIDLIEKIGAQSIIGRATRSVFEQMVARGEGDLNDSELIDTLRAEHGTRRPAKS